MTEKHSELQSVSCPRSLGYFKGDNASRVSRRPWVGKLQLTGLYPSLSNLILREHGTAYHEPASSAHYQLWLFPLVFLKLAIFLIPKGILV
jgi:hypothetical protein